MDTRAVTVAAIACMLTSVGFIVGATAGGGINARFVGNAGIGLGALAGGLLAGARLYSRVERLEHVVLQLRDELGIHKRHDQQALEEAAGLEGATTPQDVPRLGK